MKKKFLFLLLISIFFVSCNDPIFFTVSRELPPLKPIIGGSPSKMVLYSGNMYVASGKILYSYNGGWSNVRTFSWIRDIAATSNALYVCHEAGKNGVITNIFSGEQLAAPGNVNSIFGTPNGPELYLSTSNNNGKFNIYEYNGSSFSLVISDVSDLRGAANDGVNTYICVVNGVYTSSGTAIVNSVGLSFTGIILLPDNSVFVMSRDGSLRQINTATNELNLPITRLPNSSSGALCIWTDGVNYLLLAGLQDINTSINSSDTHGYRELELNDTGGITANTGFKWPGASFPTTVSDESRYISSIGKHGLNSIFQAPDGVLFASTQQKGLWSYRNRERHGGWQWNAE